jgi:hypothetical protein
MKTLFSIFFTILITASLFSQEESYISNIRSDDNLFLEKYIKLNDNFNYKQFENMFGVTITDENLYFCIDPMACNFNTYYKYNSVYASDYPKLIGTIWNPTTPVVGKCFYKTEFKDLFTMSCNCSFDWEVNREKYVGAFFGTGEGGTTLTPIICEDVAIAGNGTGSKNVSVSYPCNVEYGLYDVGTGNSHYEIKIPTTMKKFVFKASTGDGIVANIYYNSATTIVSKDNSTGNVTVNFIDTDKSKLPKCD